MLFIPRKLFTRIRDLWLVRKIAIFISSRRHARWQMAHPGASFGEYYAAAHMRKLARGWPHATLGQLGWNHAGMPTQWDKASFAARGGNDWKHIQAMGVKSTDHVVDYGCGSLRVGQHAIRFLDPDCYWGLDVTNDFFGPAITMLDTGLVAQKRPKVGIIGPDNLAQVTKWKPDILFSNAVLQHVPPAELRAYFEAIASLLGPGAVALVIFVVGKDGERYQGMNWRYSGSTLTRLVSDIDGDLEVAIEELSEDHAADNGRDKQLLRIRRPDAR